MEAALQGIRQTLLEENPENSKLHGGALEMPISGIFGSLSVLVFLDAVPVHLAAVSLHKIAPSVTTLQQQAIVCSDAIIDTLMVSSGVTACGTVPEGSQFGISWRPPHNLLAD